MHFKRIIYSILETRTVRRGSSQCYSVAGDGMVKGLFFLQYVLTGCGTHPTAYSMGRGDSTIMGFF
jgi:hypothetical protein